jgi:hypothetical protein
MSAEQPININRLYRVCVYEHPAQTNPSWSTNVNAFSPPLAIICAMTQYVGHVERVTVESFGAWGQPSPEWTGD